jgi:hypothetical protein
VLYYLPHLRRALDAKDESLAPLQVSTKRRTLVSVLK